MKTRKFLWVSNFGRASAAAQQLLTVLFVLTCFMTPAVSTAQSLLVFPQKIVIDADRDRLLVSNYGGGGSLVQIDADGTQTYFVQRAGCVDGIDIVGDVIYGVGNSRRLFGYNLDTGERVLNFKIPGNVSAYLSSVTSDEAGHLFISCPALHTIYKFKLSDESYTVFAQGNGLNRPNGILLEKENNRIVVIDDSANTSIIHAIDLADATVSDLITAEFHYPDGVVRDVNGTYYVGGYYLPGLYRISADFAQPPEMFFEGNQMIYPTYDAQDHSLLVTYYGDHSWERVMLPAGTLEGTVSLLPPADLVNVVIRVGAMTISPDSTGSFSKNVPVGVFDVTASLDGYETAVFEGIEFTEDQETLVNFELHALPPPDTSRSGTPRRFQP